MKATVDIPDLLYRQVKAQSALAGRSVRDVTVELYRRWLADMSVADRLDDDGTPADVSARWLASWVALGEEIAGAAVDERGTREILLADRR